jgi:serine protease Do
MWRRFILVLGLLCAVAACAAPAPQAAGDSQAIIDALTRAHAAVVGVDVTAADGARTSETMGHERSGSGVVIGPDGLILTIGYLMVEADRIEIETQDGRTFPAKAVAYDVATGFGLIKPLLPLPEIRAVPLGTLQNLPTGERLVVVTGGDDGEMAITQLLSKRPFAGYWEYYIEAAVFTSPPVTNHSGAALFNERGELVGIGSLFVGDALGRPPRVAGNMFVPVDLLKPILPELQRTGSTQKSRRPWLGVTSTEQEGRVQVVRVTEGGPAQLGGVESGDIVLAVDEKRVASLEEFYKGIWSRPNPDDEIKLTLLHGADLKVVKLKGVDRMTTMVKPAGI